MMSIAWIIHAFSFVQLQHTSPADVVAYFKGLVRK